MDEEWKLVEVLTKTDDFLLVRTGELVDSDVRVETYQNNKGDAKYVITREYIDEGAFIDASK